MPRVDPLVLLTLLGLVGAGLLGVLHPPEALDPDDPLRQAGRNVRFELEVLAATHGDGWSSGSALPAGTETAVIEWIWFRPADPPPLVGDRLVGSGTLQRVDEGVQLVLSGASAASVVPGPHPVPVRWDELVERPEAHEGRLLVVNGIIADGAVHDPERTHHCPLAEASLRLVPHERLLVRLQRLAHGPGFECIVEGGAP